MATLDLDDVSVTIAGSPLLDHVSMHLADGDFVGIVGPSGSGKTMLLRAVAGLVRTSGGTISFDGVDMTREQPGRRDVGMVFQQAVLLPHVSVRRNVAFPLEVRRRTVEEIRRRVDAEVRALHIEDLLLQRPDELSYGERQMVQIARALVRVPKLLLLDEPFASLDEHLRQRMRSEIAMLQAGYGVTTLMTTNDPRDVAALTASVIVLDGGRVAQIGNTADVRRSPHTLFAAAATGDVSTFDVTVIADGTGSWLVRNDPSGGPGLRIRAWSPALAHYDGRLATVAVRPEDVIAGRSGPVEAVVDRSIPGATVTLQVLAAGAHVAATPTTGETLSRGDAVRLRFDHVMVFDRSTGASIS